MRRGSTRIICSKPIGGATNDSEEVRKAKTLIGDWVAARRTRAAIAEGDPKAFGDQAEKDKELDSATAQVEHFKAKATAAINEAYGIS